MPQSEVTKALLKRKPDFLQHFNSLRDEATNSFFPTIQTWFQDFKNFIDQGSVLELGIGIVIGNAFSNVVESFVADILTPPMGLFLGANFEHVFIVLRQGATNKTYKTVKEAQEDGAVTENIGNFMEVFFKFLTVAAALYVVIRGNIPFCNILVIRYSGGNLRFKRLQRLSKERQRRNALSVIMQFI